MPCMSLFLFMPPLQAYTDELVELHRRLMALRERNVLQQVEIICQLSGRPLYSGKLGVQGSQADPCDLSLASPHERVWFTLKADA